MQRVDYAAAQRVDHFIANSENTRERIKKYYGRESDVVYPGVSILINPSVRHGNSRTSPLNRGAIGTIEPSNHQTIKPSPYYL
jgi:hypothetical protein